MIFHTLYKTGAIWSAKKQPKNHLSSEDSLTAFCGSKAVEYMGGSLEHKNGKWYSEDVIIPETMVQNTTCTKCFKIAMDKINQPINH